MMVFEVKWPDSFEHIINVNVSFWQCMANRMVQAIGKYEPAITRKEVADRARHIDEAKERMALYERTGNTEWLVDAANSLMIEFTHPQHPQAHFRAVSSHESPGIILQDGTHHRGHDEHSERRIRERRRYEGD